ncbi:MAG: para-aminobenzoate synthase, (PABA) [Peltula sp. TS41687]|nr:MAG: para-aminobenzoate synthase, (PABA) [Peltula sp. TS41687]
MDRSRVAHNRILFIDADDSFTNNIISLLETRLDASVFVWKIGLKLDHRELTAALSHFDAVVAGPGPGSPTNHADTGLMNELWKLDDEELLPALGICLGFQNLAISFGGRIECLKEPKHGRVCRITHHGESIFERVGQLHTTCYHSLHVELGYSGPGRHGGPDAEELWRCTQACPDLQPLAWDLSDKINGPVLMALRHQEKPFWGLQYHPESICTNEKSFTVIDNWWAEVMRWNWRKHHSEIPASLHSHERMGPRLQRRLESVEDSHFRRRAFTHPPRAQMNGHDIGPEYNRKVLTKVISIENMTPFEICTSLGFDKSELIILDSAVTREETGRYVIVGLIEQDQTTRFEYSPGSPAIRRYKADRLDIPLAEFQGDVYLYLADYMGKRRASGGSIDSPFWGGLVGYISYETCLSSGLLSLSPSRESSHDRSSQPGMTFAFVERSLVYDNETGHLYVQSVRRDDDGWVQAIKDKIEYLHEVHSNTPCNGHAVRNGLRSGGVIRSGSESITVNGSHPACDFKLSTPNAKAYQNRVRQCQKFIRAGDSYELCLTSQSEVKVSTSRYKDYTWPLYMTLRRRNPAPFGVYFRVGKATLLSCSPERFLSWDRKGHCQMRPIKGTVKKGPGVNRPVAEEILRQPKEQAENLMIVDLIRHDMHGVLGSGAVRVQSLMKVEEYETVFQLVSVIEGPCDNGSKAGYEADGRVEHQNGVCAPADTDTGTDTDNLRRGIGLLAASLPPGSMTGAPKKRSCELLREIEEHQPRGIYSGVVGYMCVGGGGDFSVVIRSAFKWENERHQSEMNGDSGTNGVEDRHDDDDDDGFDVWRIGAGGAVTALSTPEGEWEEMQTKLNSTLDPFTAFLRDWQC